MQTEQLTLFTVALYVLPTVHHLIFERWETNPSTYMPLMPHQAFTPNTLWPTLAGYLTISKALHKHKNNKNTPIHNS